MTNIMNIKPNKNKHFSIDVMLLHFSIDLKYHSAKVRPQRVTSLNTDCYSFVFSYFLTPTFYPLLFILNQCFLYLSCSFLPFPSTICLSLSTAPYLPMFLSLYPKTIFFSISYPFFFSTSQGVEHSWWFGENIQVGKENVRANGHSPEEWRTGVFLLIFYFPLFSLYH